MTLADREWRLVREETWDGPTNMALDEVAARTAADGGPRTVRVYRWGPSTLSLGYNQDADSVDWTRCAESGVTVTRRPTGGGGIYHDYVGDVSYSIAVPADEVPGDLMECYRLLCEPVLDAFDRLGLDVDFVDEERPALHRPACYLRALHPAHDMVADGRKVAGNAQYRRKDAVIQHGSLTYALRPEDHLACFAAPDVTPEAFRERVTGVREETGAAREEMVAAVEGALADYVGAEAGEWTDDELAAARSLAAEKYESEAWAKHGADPSG